MISLEFGPDTPERMKDLVKSIPPYDLLQGYRQAAQEFNTTDIVLIIAVHDEEVLAFEAKPRAVYVKEAFNNAATTLHPMAKTSAHRHMKMPKDNPAFWLVLELRDKDTVLTCAIGGVSYKTEAVAN